MISEGFRPHRHHYVGIVGWCGENKTTFCLLLLRDQSSRKGIYYQWSWGSPLPPSAHSQPCSPPSIAMRTWLLLGLKNPSNTSHVLYAPLLLLLVTTTVHSLSSHSLPSTVLSQLLTLPCVPSCNHYEVVIISSKVQRNTLRSTEVSFISKPFCSDTLPELPLPVLLLPALPPSGPTFHFLPFLSFHFS